jgi:transcriptional regulator with XRE-family HTH domain
MTRQSTESEEFARAFGDALARFLHERGLRQSDVAKQLGLGRRGEARLSTYCRDSRKGKRANPNAEVLYRLCTELRFEFEYKGYKITAATLNGHHPQPAETAPEQLRLEFSGQFDLTRKKGTASVEAVS